MLRTSPFSPSALILICSLLGVSTVGCTSQKSAVEPASEPPAPTEEPAPASDAPPAPADRPELTADECTAQGGTVVGDIGDGAIHRPDYRCPSGAAPSAAIRANDDGPVAVEGSVCCPG